MRTDDVTTHAPAQYQDLAQKGGFGVKALVLLDLCGTPAVRSGREAGYREACHRFSPKGVDRKLRELQERGYIANDAAQPWLCTLTARGRQALESAPMSA